MPGSRLRLCALPRQVDLSVIAVLHKLDERDGETALFDWLGKWIGSKSAADARGPEAASSHIVAECSRIYAQTPLSELMEKRRAEHLAREYFLEINQVCGSREPVKLLREKLATQMLRFAMYQVLMIPPAPEPDPFGMRGLPGITGELAARREQLVDRDIALGSSIHEVDEFDENTDIDRLVSIEFWRHFWNLETLNAARIYYGDSTPEDWFEAFRFAACANQENIYRLDLDLPSAFEHRIALTAPTAYAIFTDIVIAGAEDPLSEWRDYHSGQNIPDPALLTRDSAESRRSA